MDLITPGTGLIFWQLFGFLGLLFILIKFAWKPMLEALEERESSIENALKSAETARSEIRARYHLEKGTGYIGKNDRRG